MLSKILAVAALLLVAYDVEAFVSPQQPRTTTSSSALAGYGIGSWNKKSLPPPSGGAGAAVSTRKPWDDVNAANKVNKSSDTFAKASSSPAKSAAVKKSYGLGSWSKSTSSSGGAAGSAAVAGSTSSRNPWDDVNAANKVNKSSDTPSKAPSSPAKSAAKKKSYGLGSWSKSTSSSGGAGSSAVAGSTSSRNPWDDVNAANKVNKASDAFTKEQPKSAAKTKSYGLGSWSK